MNSIPGITLLFLACAIACAPDSSDSAPPVDASREQGPAPENPQSSARAGTVIDSALPMEELVRRFQAGLPAVDALENGESTRDALVRRFVAAVAGRDSAILGTMVITRPEYGYVYFPGSHLARPPYELDPGYAWFHVRSESESGIRRALGVFGGRALDYVGHTCTTDSAQNGPVRIWKNCKVRLRRDGGPPAEVGLFASIIEHRGQFKFFSYANGL